MDQAPLLTALESPGASLVELDNPVRLVVYPILPLRFRQV
jgi:hypothetical protein